MPCVILEGPDGAGKTELGKELLDGPCKGWDFLHNGTHEGTEGRALFQLYAKQILSGRDRGLLIDRSFDSELIYGPIMRKEDRLGELGRTLLNRLCSAQGVVQVLCLPPKEVAEVNWRAKAADYVPEVARWSAIYEGFAALKKNKRYVWYDYTWNEARTRDDLARRFSAIFKITQNFALPMFPGIVGSPRAGYLIVGEQVNLKKYWVDLPFFDVRGVSKFLYETLAYLKAEESNLLFMNAFDVQDNPNDVAKVFNQVKTLKRIVALGEKAYRAVRHAAPNVVKVHHPNYSMRFDDTRKFKRDLRRALGL